MSAPALRRDRGLGRFPKTIAGLALLFAVGWGLPAAASAPEQGWIRFVGADGCLGGGRCDTPALYLVLRDLPVRGIRFEAMTGTRRGRTATLSVRIDDDVLTDRLELEGRWQPYRLEVSQARGRSLVLKPIEGREIRVRNIEVLYGGLEAFDGSLRRYRTEDRPPPRRRSSPQATGLAPLLLPEVGCLGGSCHKSRVSVRLSGAPIQEIRFYARGGSKDGSGGLLRVLLDDVTLVSAAAVPDQGQLFRIDVEGKWGGELTFEPAAWKPVSVENLRVTYGRGSGGSGGSAGSGQTSGSICLGGAVCGRRWSMEIPIEPSDRALRFFAQARDSFRPASLRASRGAEALLEVEVRPGGEFFEVDLEPEEGSSRRSSPRAARVVLEALREAVLVEEIELHNGSSWRRYRPASDEAF